jgi:hypothetical protein
MPYSLSSMGCHVILAEHLIFRQGVAASRSAQRGLLHALRGDAALLRWGSGRR